MHQTFSVALSPPVSICGVNINWRMLLWYSNFFGIQKGFFGLLFTLTIKYICYLGTHFQWARCNHLPLFAPPDQDLSMWTVLVEAHYKMHSISIDCDGNETPSPSHSLHVTMWGDAGSKYVNQELWGILYKDQYYTKGRAVGRLAQVYTIWGCQLFKFCIVMIHSIGILKSQGWSTWHLNSKLTWPLQGISRQKPCLLGASNSKYMFLQILPNLKVEIQGGDQVYPWLPSPKIDQVSVGTYIPSNSGPGYIPDNVVSGAFENNFTGCQSIPRHNSNCWTSPIKPRYLKYRGMFSGDRLHKPTITILWGFHWNFFHSRHWVKEKLNRLIARWNTSVENN